MFSMLIELALQNLLFFALHLENNGAFPKQLTKAEEAECLKRLAEGDPNARNKLIEHNLRLVAYIVRKNYSEANDQDDLISIGTIGLIKAAETFDVDKKISFSTYASKCIDNQIKMHFRKTKRLKTEVLIYDPIDVDKDGNQISLADLFCDPTCVADEVDLLISFRKLYRYINETLDEREKSIICMRYGICNTASVPQKALTQREVADKLNISRSYVSRIEKKALAKLKTRFDGKD